MKTAQNYSFSAKNDQAQNRLNQIALTSVKDVCIELSTKDEYTDLEEWAFEQALFNVESRMNESDFVTFASYLESLI